MLDLARKFIEQNPAFQKPAHLTFKTFLNVKNALLHPVVEHLGYVPRSLSDRGQDRWVLETLGGKQGGFFLDMGAADGFSESNTYVLEKRHGWTGICIEPNPVFYDQLVNRYHRSCICVSELVDQDFGEVDFVLAGQESGVVATGTDNDEQGRTAIIDTKRAQGQVKRMTTVPLAAVLDKCGAPSAIDYFSFDVEGAETRILRNFEFNRYKFLTMTIERPTEELNTILFQNGYHFVKNALYDTFYVHSDIPNFDSIPRKPFEQVPPKAF